MRLSQVKVLANGSVLTIGQRIALDLLKKHAKNKKVVTRDIIIELYRKYRNAEFEAGLYSPSDFKNNWDTAAMATQWFNNTVGALVSKGKITVLPVIKRRHHK